MPLLLPYSFQQIQNGHITYNWRGREELDATSYLDSDFSIAIHLPPFAQIKTLCVCVYIFLSGS